MPRCVKRPRRQFRVAAQSTVTALSARPPIAYALGDVMPGSSLLLSCTAIIRGSSAACAYGFYLYCANAPAHANCLREGRDGRSGTSNHLANVGSSYAFAMSHNAPTSLRRLLYTLERGYSLTASCCSWSGDIGAFFILLGDKRSPLLCACARASHTELDAVPQHVRTAGHRCRGT